MRPTFALMAAGLGLAAFPAAAQSAFPTINPARISGATIEQADIIDPRDFLEDGTTKPDARIVREARKCALDAATAREAAAALGRARRSVVEWEGISADMVIRFKGADGNYGELVAVIEGYNADSPFAEKRVFFAGLAAFLTRGQEAQIVRISADAGCPFFRPPAKD